MKRRSPGVLRCMLLLLLVDVSLRWLGFARTVSMARRIAKSGSAERNDNRSLVVSTLHNVLVATAFYPGRSKCLEQSVAVFVLLRRRGFNAHIKMGVQPYPFFAHAWVELDDVVITESNELIAGLARLPEVA
jgi:hypothetical protein